MTVYQLVEALKDFNPRDHVVGTWEGLITGISVYAGAPGTVVIDADGNEYKNRLEGRVTWTDDNVVDMQERIEEETDE
jgi:hypothetical protein